MTFFCLLFLLLLHQRLINDQTFLKGVKVLTTKNICIMHLKKTPGSGLTLKTKQQCIENYIRSIWLLTKQPAVNSQALYYLTPGSLSFQRKIIFLWGRSVINTSLQTIHKMLTKDPGYF